MNFRGKGADKISQYIHRFCIAGILIEISSSVRLRTGRGLANYVFREAVPDDEECIRISVAQMEDTGEDGYVLCGTDMLLEYYCKESDGRTVWRCEAPGRFGPVTRSTYTDGLAEVYYEINETAYPGHITSVDKILQLFPMRQLLFEKQVFLLHSSQAVIEGKGILFTADSGVGKTTQAKLLEKLYQAEIVCNDRTAISKSDGKWKTAGFPIDGSTPVNHTGTWDLAAVIVLVQAEENRISRYSGLPAVKDLMRQLMLDIWNPRMCAETAQRLISFLEEIPVYRLECTADERAAACLMERLRKDEVI